MKNRIVITFMCLLLPSVVFANCGSIPEAPQQLEEAQLSAEQLELLDPQMQDYIASIGVYRACIDDSVANLAPANATGEFFDSESYQSDFQNLVNFSDLAEQSMSFSVQRFNFLVENVGEQLVNIDE